MLALNLALIVAWPWLAAPLRDSLDPAYAWLCHREPSRCYRLGGEPMPACARCVGVWLGLTAMALLAALAGLWRLRTGLALLAWLSVSWVVGGWLPAGWLVERTVAGVAGGLGAYVIAARLPGWLGRAARRLRLFSSRAVTIRPPRRN